MSIRQELIEACKLDDIGEIKRLYHHPQIEFLENDSEIMCTLAIIFSSIEAFEFLSEKLEFDLPNKKESLLYNAIREEKIDVIKYLIEDIGGINFNYTAWTGNSLMDEVFGVGNIEAINYFLYDLNYQLNDTEEYNLKKWRSDHVTTFAQMVANRDLFMKLSNTELLEEKKNYFSKNKI